MTITQVLQEIHKLYEKNTDYPASGEDDFSIRIALVNQGINLWESDKNIIWNELWTTETGTITDGDDTYTLPTNFVFPAGFLRIYDSNSRPTLYNIVNPEKDHLEEFLNTGKKYAYITGGNANKVLNINPTPDAQINGQTYKLSYYKRASTYSTGSETNELEMMDPYFVIYHALTQLYLDDLNTVQAQVMQQVADQKLSAMRIQNEASTFYQHDDIDAPYFGGFGI